MAKLLARARPLRKPGATGAGDFVGRPACSRHDIGVVAQTHQAAEAKRAAGRLDVACRRRCVMTDDQPFADALGTAASATNEPRGGLSR